MGPYGRNVIIERSGRPPYISNDGVTVARSIVLKDEIENLGAQAVIDAAVRTEAMVGDGTTTTTVLIDAITNNVYNLIGDQDVGIGNVNVMDYRRDIKENCAKVIEELDKMTVPVKIKKQIEDVATICVEDREMGKKIAEMIQKIGPDGCIMVEEGFKYETETDVIPGMKLVAGFISPLLATRRQEAVWEGSKIYILVTNNPIDSAYGLAEFVGKIIYENKKINKLVVISPEFDKDVIGWSVGYSRNASSLCKILGINACSLTDEQLQDIATYTGAVFIDKEKKMSFENMTTRGAYITEEKVLDANGQVVTKPKTNLLSSILGSAKKVVADKDYSFIINGYGDKKEIKKRITKLKEDKDKEKTDIFKKKIDQRIASLAGGVGVIKVGSQIVIDARYQKQKVDDAVAATKLAVESGVVPGGGLALFKIANKLPKNILTEALKEPYLHIQKSAGGELAIGKEVIDPVKVVKAALMNACYAAGLIITIGSAIAQERGGLAEELTQTLNQIGLEKKRVQRYQGRGEDDIKELEEFE